MRAFLESEAGQISVLASLTAAGVVFYFWTRDKYVVELFGGALLLAMKGGHANKPSGD